MRHNTHLRLVDLDEPHPTPPRVVVRRVPEMAIAEDNNGGATLTLRYPGPGGFQDVTTLMRALAEYLNPKIDAALH